MAAANTQGPRAPKLPQLLERDPYLAPFEQDFQRRYRAGGGGCLPSPCSALPSPFLPFPSRRRAVGGLSLRRGGPALSDGDASAAGGAAAAGAR